MTFCANGFAFSFSLSCSRRVWRSGIPFIWTLLIIITRGWFGLGVINAHITSWKIDPPCCPLWPSLPSWLNYFNLLYVASWVPSSKLKLCILWMRWSSPINTVIPCICVTTKEILPLGTIICSLVSDQSCDKNQRTCANFGATGLCTETLGRPPQQCVQGNFNPVQREISRCGNMMFHQGNMRNNS